MTIVSVALSTKADWEFEIGQKCSEISVLPVAAYADRSVGTQVAQVTHWAVFS